MILILLMLAAAAPAPNSGIAPPVQVPAQAQEVFPRGDYSGKSTVEVPANNARTLQVFIDRTNFGDKNKQIFLRIESDDGQNACYATISTAEKTSDRPAYQVCNFPAGNQKFKVSIDARTDTGQMTNGTRDPAKEKPATINTMVQAVTK